MVDCGCDSEESCDYPEFGAAVGRKVAASEADRGIVVCGTGLGIAMAANKINGIRAAVVHDAFTARMSREHNDANVLALGARVLDPDFALELVDLWLSTEFEGTFEATEPAMPVPELAVPAPPAPEPEPEPDVAPAAEEPEPEVAEVEEPEPQRRDPEPDPEPPTPVPPQRSPNPGEIRQGLELARKRRPMELPMPKKYMVELSEEEREELDDLVRKGKVAARKRQHAQILLKADSGPHGPGWTDERTAEAYGVTVP